MRRFDVVVVGGGSGAEAICGAGLGGASVAVIEELRFGGECPFLACMPSKSMLHSATRHHLAAGPAPGGPSPAAYHAAAARRDLVAEQQDDTGHARALREQGAELIRAHAVIVAPGVVQAGEERLEAEALVIATGSEPTLPPIEGLAEVDYWLSDRLLTSPRLPASAAILGGGPVGCELAQMLARFGCRTTLIEVAERLLLAEDPALGEAMAATLASDGVELRLGRRVTSVSSRPGEAVVIHSEVEPVEVQVLVVATGRRPRVHGLGLEVYGLEPGARQLDTDPQCRALGQEHLFGVGDVTGVAPFTHTANYQGRVVAANLRGKRVSADYRAIPRAVYTDPPVAAVGLSLVEASRRGISAVRVTARIGDTARALTDEVERGEVVLIADRARGVLVGAAMAGPSADESIAWAALAIRAEIGLELLRDTVSPFPTYSEAWSGALAQLAL